MSIDIENVNIAPTSHRVLIKLIEVETKTKSGIVLPGQHTKREQQGGQFATVLAIGPNAFKDFGDSSWCKVGDVVVTARYPGVQVYSNRADASESELALLRVINDEEIIGVATPKSTYVSGDPLAGSV